MPVSINAFFLFFFYNGRFCMRKENKRNCRQTNIHAYAKKWVKKKKKNKKPKERKKN